MIPVSLEEQIICFADKFFSKERNRPAKEKSVEKIIAGIEKYGDEQVLRFQQWVDRFT